MPTRPRGLVPRANGVWYDRRPGPNGRDVWRSLRTKDYETALQRFKAKALGASESASHGTIAELGATWINAVLPTQRSPKNVAMARTRWKRYMDRFLGHLPACRLTGDDVRAFRLWLDKQKKGKGKNAKPLQPLTVLHILQDLGACLRWAAEEGRIPKNPFPRRVMPRAQESAPEPFSESEVDHLLLAPEPYRFAIRFLLATGCRWAEACRALRTDVTVDGWLIVHHQTKNRRVRRVPLGREILTEIVARKRRLLDPFLEDNPGLFSRAVARLTKVRRFGPQRLKDTFACQFLSVGGNITALQLILGHQDPKTTQRYGKPSDDFIRAEMEKTRPGRESVATSVAAGSEGYVNRTAKLQAESNLAPVAQVDRAAVS